MSFGQAMSFGQEIPFGRGPGPPMQTGDAFWMAPGVVLVTGALSGLTLGAHTHIVCGGLYNGGGSTFLITHSNSQALQNGYTHYIRIERRGAFIFL